MTPPPPPAQPPKSDIFWATWSIAAAFITYFSMYGFRKPFTAASFDDTFFEQQFKVIVVVAQVIGYTISKFMGIKIISEMSPAKRAATILALIAIAQAALALFGIVPRPWNAACLLLNGLPLGMVFGLVMGFLEGRRLTELLAAGLCASFILADGVTKSLGAWLLEQGVAEDWMPAVAGIASTPTLLLGVFMLTRIPRPSPADESHRAERTVMTSGDRRALFAKYAIALVPLIVMYLALTVLRSLRADFQPELWKALGESARPATFTYTETIVAFVVLIASGAVVMIRSNRAAFFVGLGACLVGFAMLGVAFWAQRNGAISAFTYMVLMGLGLYLPYVMVHTTIFERMLAMTREKGNLGFLMYLADSFGYLGYVAVLLGKGALRGTGGDADEGGVLKLFTSAGLLIAGVCAAAIIITWLFFARRPAGHAQPIVDAAGAPRTPHPEGQG